MAYQTIANLKGPVGDQGPRGLPGVNAVANDEATAAYVEANDSETGQALDQKVGPTAVLNPETPMNDAVTQVTRNTMAAGAPGFMKIVDARGNPGVARPAWLGTVFWRVNQTDANPAGYLDGDVVLQESDTPQNWSPLNISSLRMWFDPTAAGVANGSSVSSVPVKGWVGGAFTQPASGSRPVYRAQGIGTGPSLEFDGANDFLRSEQFAAFDTRSPSEVIAVIQPANPDPSSTQYAWDAVNGSGQSFSGPAFGLNGATNTWQLNRGAGLTGGLPVAAPRVIRVYNATNGNSLAQINNVTAVSGAPGENYSHVQWTLGARGDGATAFWSGHIGHWFEFGDVLSLETRQRVYDWINERYGTSVTT